MDKYLAKAIIAAIDVQDGKVPEWILLYEAGWCEVEGEEPFMVDRQAFDALVSYVSRRGNDIVIDFEHQTLKGVKAPAAGWMKEYRWDEAKGISVRVEWNAEAEGYILKKEYRYFSPVSIVRKKDKRLIAVHSVALTNAPRTNHLTPILAKLGEDFQKKEDTGMDFLKRLIAKLGLKPEADEDQVVEAVETVVAKNKDLEAAKPKEVEVIAKDVLDALDLTEGDTSTVVASIHALKQSTKGGVSRTEFDKLQKDLRKRDADEIVAKAILEGKVTPDQKEWANEYANRDLDGFKTFVAKAPVVVPVKDLPEKKNKGGAVIDETVLNVAKMMGNTEDDVKQYGGVQEA